MIVEGAELRSLGDRQRRDWRVEMVNELVSVVAANDGFRPVLLLEVELSRPLPAVSAVDPTTGEAHKRVFTLVRLHTHPLGVAWLEIGEHGLAPDEFASQVWAHFQGRITEHLRQDDLPEMGELGPDGLPTMAAPPCTRDRRLVLEDAPFVSVVIPTRDRPELIRTCLASLSVLDYPDYEVLVVDNAPSSDATKVAVTEMTTIFPRARYLREDRPGASWARNRGLREARGEIVAFTDDDVTVDRYWLAQLVKGFGLADDVGCVTGNVLPRELATPAQVWLEERGGFRRGFERRIYDMGENRSGHPLYPFSAMMFGSGNNMAFRASVLRAIEGFDPALDPAGPALGGEDLAAFFEVVVRGHRLVYEPAAFVNHLHRRDYEGLRRQMYGWGVGFSAFLTRSLIRHPQLIPNFTVKLPYGLFVLLRGRMPYSQSVVDHLDGLLPVAQTRALRRVESAGYWHGTLAYMRSRQRVRRLIGRYGGLSVA